jgi:NAD(P)H-dependent FMN reductase
VGGGSISLYVAKLGVVIASVRDGRVGLPVAQWFMAIARTHAAFEVDVIDLQATNLPMLSEPHHPRLQRYQQESTKRWSATVTGFDAFVIVTPEYNHGAPPALVNALDHLYVEWNYKPAGFVSYGGVSGGTRSVQTTKLLLAALKMVPIVEAVNIPFVGPLIDKESGAFKGGEPHAKAATLMLDELTRWTRALQTLRS